MPPVAATEYDSVAVRLATRRTRAEHRALTRARWWFPLVVPLLMVSACWGLLRADQWIADELIWPTSGAQFVEVGPLPTDPTATGARIVIVTAGLNRKSGTGVAAALMPSLTTASTRVFSLVYGSGINDKDILDKFDRLIGELRPREVSFFGSSMGGDVVLNLAAHTREMRADHLRTLGAGTDPGITRPADPDATVADPADPASAPHAQAQRDNRVGGQTIHTPGLLVSPDPAIGSLVGIDTRAAGRPAGVVTDPPAASAPGTSKPSTGPVTGRVTAPPPRLGTIFLDCSPLGVDDVRDPSRTSADALTALMEALDSEGGVAVRMTAELLGQQQQWSWGRFPFLQVRGADLDYKFTQVWREKVGAPGISTNLIKDQYGVIRRMDIDDIVDSLGPGTRIVYFLPANRDDDRTVRVERVESTLLQLADAKNLDVRIVEIAGGHHASAESTSDVYRAALDGINGGAT